MKSIKHNHAHIRFHWFNVCIPPQVIKSVNKQYRYCGLIQ